MLQCRIGRRFLSFSNILRYSAHEERLFQKYRDVHYCEFHGGDGGMGAMHFDRDCQNAYMGPDGGNGGVGGSVYLRDFGIKMVLIKVLKK